MRKGQRAPGGDDQKGNDSVSVLEEVGKWPTTSITGFQPAEMNLK